jgi:hypothetical protein
MVMKPIIIVIGEPLTTLEKLEPFNLADHGDRHERERWPMLRDRFPEYETFWKLYIVPLTNRIVNRLQDSSWIRLRPDVPDDWEKVAVCHYSVFYYLSRAAQRRIELFGGRQGVPAFPEDVIFLLQICCENVYLFCKALGAVAGGAASCVPDVRKASVFREIDAYRNLLLHSPVLGRGESAAETFLPKLFGDWKGVHE